MHKKGGKKNLYGSQKKKINQNHQKKKEILLLFSNNFMHKISKLNWVRSILFWFITRTLCLI